LRNITLVKVHPPNQ